MDIHQEETPPQTTIELRLVLVPLDVANALPEAALMRCFGGQLGGYQVHGNTWARLITWEHRPVGATGSCDPGLRTETVVDAVTGNVLATNTGQIVTFTCAQGTPGPGTVAVLALLAFALWQRVRT